VLYQTPDSGVAGCASKASPIMYEERASCSPNTMPHRNSAHCPPSTPLPPMSPTTRENSQDAKVVSEPQNPVRSPISSPGVS
jgi:hypothetical protein